VPYIKSSANRHLYSQLRFFSRYGKELLISRSVKVSILDRDLVVRVGVDGSERRRLSASL